MSRTLEQILKYAEHDLRETFTDPYYSEALAVGDDAILTDLLNEIADDCAPDTTLEALQLALDDHYLATSPVSVNDDEACAVDCIRAMVREEVLDRLRTTLTALTPTTTTE